jgi:hypothetical protein
MFCNKSITPPKHSLYYIQFIIRGHTVSMSDKLHYLYRWVDGWMGGWVDGWVGGWVDGWMDGWMDVWVGGWVEGWMDG